MNKPKIFILIFIFLFTGVIVFAQSTLQIPKGMESIRVGDSAEIIVPKGSKLTKIGSRIIVESPDEYVARRLEETEERFTAIEQNQEMLRKEIDSLKAMQQVSYNALIPPSNSVIVP